MEKQNKTVDGQEITEIFTRGSHYDNQCLLVRVGYDEYLMPAETVLQMVNEFTFTVEQKRTWKHLIRAKGKMK